MSGCDTVGIVGVGDSRLVIHISQDCGITDINRRRAFHVRCLALISLMHLGVRVWKYTWWTSLFLINFLPSYSFCWSIIGNGKEAMNLHMNREINAEAFRYR